MTYTFKIRRKKEIYGVHTLWNQYNNSEGVRMAPLYWKGKYDNLHCHFISDGHIMRYNKTTKKTFLRSSKYELWKLQCHLQGYTPNTAYSTTEIFILIKFLFSEFKHFQAIFPVLQLVENTSNFCFLLVFQNTSVRLLLSDHAILLTIHCKCIVIKYRDLVLKA